MRRLVVVCSTVCLIVAGALPAWACGGLVAPNGAVQLLRTSTLAAHHDGVEHYVTSFAFGSAEESFGSIVPLPGVPSAVERGGDWTLQRLAIETQPQNDRPQLLAPVAAGAEEESVEVLLETRIDALDITVLRGGGQAVFDWTAAQGFALSDDAPEVLDFYARRSPVFMAARFDADAARADGFTTGDGVPIHLTIPTDNPWVPLRILSLGKPAQEIVEADIYLLTDDRPAYLSGAGVVEQVSRPASDTLLDDLRADAGMGWVPGSMWLTYLRVDAPAGSLTYDLAVDASGAGQPSLSDSGLSPLKALAGDVARRAGDAPWLPLGAAGAVAVLLWWAVAGRHKASDSVG